MVALTENVILSKTRAENLGVVRNLNVWGSDLSDVSILSQLPNVEVLSLSVNKIASLKDFTKCQRLQELYLRKNDISSISDLHHISHIQSLRVLWLADNPVATTPGMSQSLMTKPDEDLTH